MLLMVPKATGHLRPQDIEQFSMGDISETRLALLEEHLLLCELCRNRVVESDRLVNSMQRAARRIRQEEAVPLGSWHLKGWVPLAALAAIVAGALLFGWSYLAPKPAFAVRLTATRGADLLAHAPPGTPLALLPDLTGLPASSSYSLEIVDAAGRRIWRGTLPAGQTPPQRAGTYFVRIYSASGEVLREYGLVIE